MVAGRGNSARAPALEDEECPPRRGTTQGAFRLEGTRACVRGAESLALMLAFLFGIPGRRHFNICER